MTSLEKIAATEHHQSLTEYRSRKRTAKESKVDFDETEPLMRRYTTDDCTTPKLRELMGNNPRGIILHNDELKGQLEKFDKPGSEGDRSFMMQCWSGMECYNEDRMTRLGGYMIPLTLTWIGCVPPAALAAYLRQASYGSGADGFMQRFQMVTFPDVNQPYEICNEIIPPELERRLQKLFVDMDIEALRKSERVLKFDVTAQAHFDSWQIELENSCRSGEHPTFWESHLRKQSKLLASLCIVLHRLYEVCTAQTSCEISLCVLQGAMTLRFYYQEHARKCYDSIESVEVVDARKILELIKKNRLSDSNHKIFIVRVWGV